MTTYSAVHIRDLAKRPYWTLIRQPPGELLRAEYRFESKQEADQEAARLNSMAEETEY
jgi:hypothetical protein